MSSKSVYVGNLDWGISSEQLKEHMASAGAIVSADVPVRGDGKSKGFGLVEYETEAAAKAAVEKLHDSELGTRKVFIREDRGPSEKTEGKGKGKGKGRKGKGKGKGKGGDEPAAE